MSSIEHLIPAILTGELSVKEAMRGRSLSFADGGEFFMELFQAMLDHWRAQAPETLVPSPLVYVLFMETSDLYGNSELVGAYTTHALAETAGDGIRRYCTAIRKLILDAAPHVPEGYR